MRGRPAAAMSEAGGGSHIAAAKTVAAAHPAIEHAPFVKLTVPVGAEPVTVAVNGHTGAPVSTDCVKLVSVVVVAVPAPSTTCTVSGAVGARPAETTLIETLGASTKACADQQRGVAERSPVSPASCRGFRCRRLPDRSSRTGYSMRICAPVVRIAGDDERVECRPAAGIRSSRCDLRCSWELLTA